ncbi:MAG: AAA family ATPase [Chloroherpetonaceae bacterium]|nr:AAA family ATPase [bacterium]
MKFTFENFGYIDKGEITPGNLTIIAGENNMGKTYISYTIYSLLYSLHNREGIPIDDELSKQLLETRKISINLEEYSHDFFEIIQKISANFSQHIYDIFSVEKGIFTNTIINLEINEYIFPLNKTEEGTIDISTQDKVKYIKEKGSYLLNVFLEKNTDANIPEFIIQDILGSIILEIFIKGNVREPFIITSERTGVALFYKELDISKNILIDTIAKSEKINIPSLFFRNLSRYPESIRHNIDVIRDFATINKKESFINNDLGGSNEVIFRKIKEILHGQFLIENDQILFKPVKEKGKKKVSPIPFHITSSSTKSIFLLDLYLKSIAQPNDILMIDEPELNLHPTNQIIMARLLANIVNLGVDVMITTHSDYIIKELNNLIMLSNEFPDKEHIIETYKYDESDILKPEKVKAYFVEKHTIKEAKIDKYGIDYELFDNTIYDLNKRSDDIYYSIKE